eukprot:CAMPEP_0204897290 /NCGR_PEP_ID=MMETSP1397-20131031/651_1 /ASSEMBLY_ACC=CAM_ASM_000891 /TAXON_ID=49980 /ORGANISM="Climacostomum Climacostomum virens, Strain Stock W-24" /LENGTH=737 /DNA_ID=CAMNT_0052065017 /DNA_START=759 /DNA_END=2969 /DNA_ORIENTATION=-
MNLIQTWEPPTLDPSLWQQFEIDRANLRQADSLEGRKKLKASFEALVTELEHLARMRLPSVKDEVLFYQEISSFWELFRFPDREHYQVVELEKLYELRTKPPKKWKSLFSINTVHPENKSEEARLDQHIGLSKANGLKNYYSKCRLPDYNAQHSEATLFDAFKYTGKSGKKVVVCVAMYNEGQPEVSRTIEGVAANVGNGKLPPEELLCVIICDGIKPFLDSYNKATNAPYFKELGVDISKIDAKFRDSSQTTLNLPNKLWENYEETEGFDIEHNKQKFKEERGCLAIEDIDEYAHCFKTIYREGKVKFDLVWVIKQANRRKLNTHLWFFEGICPIISPEYVILLDIGTGPQESSLKMLIDAMEHDPNVAGCCGEIVPDKHDFFNVVQGAQVVEYKFAHIFDKALESVIGFITVLPGAFSAYRWEALQGTPLDEYFYSVRHPEMMNCFKSNVYLAEDRILCNALILKKNRNYFLRFVKDSVAVTDVPDKIFVLLAQRRRWINGSRFALRRTFESRYNITEIFNCCFSCLNKTKHNCWDLFWFSFIFLYYLINSIVSYFSIGLFFLAFSLLIRQQYPSDVDSEDSVRDLFTFGDTVLKLLLVTLTVNLVVSLGASPKVCKGLYRLLMYFYAGFMCILLYFFVSFVSKGEYEGWVLYSTLLTLTSFVIIPLLHGELLSIAAKIVHFLLLTPTYLIMFQIYARCNTNDCTWGNRPDKMTNEEQKRKQEFALYRAKRIIVW